ncbi:hypothetical protein OE88DRAFT_1647592 [Heliocybe sulcata]|uniref:Uncharacterized protein n=1 Tax=Heliocybe sulcata TaxID=5364 RepID=A0A5C3MS99_9AGAM|nr:hypothetical protein OE88DRAFT_1647592 [Heliocybe sulcata]
MCAGPQASRDISGTFIAIASQATDTSQLPGEIDPVELDFSTFISERAGRMDPTTLITSLGATPIRALVNLAHITLQFCFSRNDATYGPGIGLCGRGRATWNWQEGSQESRSDSKTGSENRDEEEAVNIARLRSSNTVKSEYEPQLGFGAYVEDRGCIHKPSGRSEIWMAVLGIGNESQLYNIAG